MKLPANIESIINNSLQPEEAAIVLEEIDKTIKNEFSAPPLVDYGKTEGDWNTSLMYPETNADVRSGDKLSFEVIRDMIKSSPVVFALEMKRAAAVSVFRDERSWKVHSPDKELAGIVTANLRKILPKMALDFSYSSLVYGCSFQELVWEFTTKYELGISETKDEKKIVVAKVPNPVNPETIPYIRRKQNGTFNGFVQRPTRHIMKADNYGEIVVPADSALIMPYNEKFRDLWGESFLKAIYPIWFWYEVVLRAMVRYMERQATPVAVAGAPSRGKITKSDGTRVDALAWAMEIATNVSRSNAAVIPTDTDDKGRPLWTLDYMTSKETAQPFMDILELLTQMILRAGLNADRALSQSSGGVGSYNIGEVHARATASHNENILTQWVHYLNNYFMPHYSLYNRGRNGPPIWLETQGLDPNDMENLKALINVSGNSQTFQEALVMIDWHTLLELNNYPMLPEEEAEAKVEKLRKEKEEQKAQFQASKDMKSQAEEAKPNQKQPTPSNNDKESDTDKKLEELLKGMLL